MHNNMHITQSLCPQSFAANSVPGYGSLNKCLQCEQHTHLRFFSRITHLFETFSACVTGNPRIGKYESKPIRSI